MRAAFSTGFFHLAACLRRSGAVIAGRLAERQGDAERCANDLAVKLPIFGHNLPFVCLDDGAADGQPQADPWQACFPWAAFELLENTRFTAQSIPLEV